MGWTLSNECIRCLSTRNKRRCDPEFNFPDDVQTREEVEEYLQLCRYRKQTDIKRELEKERKGERKKWDSNSEKE